MSDEPNWNEVYKIPAYDFLKARGCEFLIEGTPTTTLTGNFGDPRAEARAVRDHVVGWDVGSTHSLEWTGPDAAAALQRVFSNDITSCPAGMGRYGALLDDTGNMIVDPIAFKFSDEHFLVTTAHNDRQDWYRHAAKDLDVDIVHSTPKYPHVQVQGPKSRELLQTLTEFDMQSLKWFRFTLERVEVAGCQVLISRTGPTAELGFELFYHPQDVEKLWTALLDAGVTPIGIEAILILKPELGAAAIELDYFPGKGTPYDVGMDRCVAINKPVEFAGKARLTEISKNPPNRFKTMKLTDDALDIEDLPEWGSPVAVGGKEVGTMTQSEMSLDFGPLAQTIIQTPFADEGTKIEIISGSKTYNAIITTTPLYDPERIKVRS
jgi:aminomethyltransferase